MRRFFSDFHRPDLGLAHRQGQTEANGKSARILTSLRGQTLQLPAMQTGDVGNNGQAKTAMALLTSGRIQTMERLEGLVPLLSGHTFALIPNLDAAAIIERMQLENHRSCAVGKGVVDQVGDCTAEGDGFHQETDRGQLQLQLIGPCISLPLSHMLHP